MAIQKQRHGCLTTWLILMIVANSITALMYLLNSQTIRQTSPGLPSWLFPVLIIVCIFNLICTIALFKWQKWGFWGFLGSSITALVINLSIGLGVGKSLLGLIGIAILYAVLNIGESNKGWSQLE